MCRRKPSKRVGSREADIHGHETRMQPDRQKFCRAARGVGGATPTPCPVGGPFCWNARDKPCDPAIHRPPAFSPTQAHSRKDTCQQNDRFGAVN